MKFERSRTHKQINTCTEKWYAMNDFFFFWAGIHKCNLHRIISLNHHAICNDGLVLPLSGVLANILALFDIFFVYLFCYFFFFFLRSSCCLVKHFIHLIQKRKEMKKIKWSISNGKAYTNELLAWLIIFITAATAIEQQQQQNCELLQNV